MMWTEMAILRKNGNAENKSIATEMKIVFDGLISILYMWLRERVSELENVSVGTSKTENKEEEKKKTGNNHREITGLSIQNCPDTQKEKQVSNRIIQRKEIGKETEEILETMKRISPNNVKHQSQLQIALAMLS